jgi:enoyl-CoA hydratase/carnithine racemase
MPYETILYEIDGPVATITLNRPDTLNAINPQMTVELHQALDAAEADGTVRAIVLTGSGRAFSAGYGIGRRPDGRSSLDPTGVELAEFLSDHMDKEEHHG